MSNGYVLYEGASQLDGVPVVAIATLGSHNKKTGGMVQTWIMRQDCEPTEAVRTGGDGAICGECPHRPSTGGSCYVVVHQAPLMVYRAWKRGVYPQAKPGAFRGLLVRLGSYGDPAAVPYEVWESFTRGARGIAGYTHQWRTCNPHLKTLCMASCDSPEDRQAAKALGWRTFRVRMTNEPRERGEAVCPASVEAGNKLTCEQCNHCGGLSSGRKGDVTILAHGADYKVVKFYRWRNAA